MANMNRIPAPIDNKNLCEDGFEDDVFCDGFMQAYDHRDGKGTRHLVGTKAVKEGGIVMESGIVDVTWNYGDNCVHITLLAVSGCANTYDWEETRKHIFDDYRNTFKTWECESNPDLRVEFYELGNRLNVIFYFELDN